MNYIDSVQIGKNKFNKATVVDQYELLSNGTSVSNTTSKHSDFIECENQGVIFITGLTPYTGTAGYLCFYNASHAFMSYVNMAANLTEFEVLIPFGAKYVRHNISRRKTGAEVINLDTIQTEFWWKTAYEAYSATTVKIPALADDTPYVLRSGKNKFNKLKYFSGYTSITTMFFKDATGSISNWYTIPSDAKRVYLSGFPTYTGTARAVRFYDANRTQISSVSMAVTETWISAVIPANTVYFFAEIYKGKTSGEVVNFDTIQIEFYGETAYEAYAETYIKPTITYPLQDTITYGKKLVAFGDSIVETADWSIDGTTYTEGNRHNWMEMAQGYLKLGTLKNYGKSGAWYQSAAQADEKQKGAVQVAAGIANNATTDIVVMNLAYNDVVITLGSLSAAMAKATLADLDKGILYEAIRWCMWSIRTAYPTAVCFAGNVLQSATYTNAQIAAKNLAIQEMAAEYGFIYVDQMNEAGVDHDAEVAGHVYLKDGIHPNHAGWLLLGRFWETKILAQF